MSVVSKNPFDLLGEDGDESPAPAPKAAPKKVEAAPARAVPGAAKPAATGGDRGARGGRPTRGAPRAPRNEGDRNTGPTSSEGVAVGMETPGGFDGERVAPSRKANHIRDAHTKGPPGDRPAKNYTSGGHSSSRGGRGGASRAPAQGGERRQFERRSGGLPDSQKKIEHGWGANEGEAELTAEVEGEADAVKEENTPQTPAEADGGWGAAEDAPAAAGGDDAAAPAAEPIEPEEIQKSLDEYLAERAAAAVSFGKKEGRQVSAETLEGQEFRRAAIDEFYAPKEKKESKSAKSAPKKEKVFIAFDGQFSTPPGGGDRPQRGDRGERGGRGGAGGERGGRGRGGPRGGAARGGRGGAGAGRGGAARGGANLDSNDKTAFPALGA